MKKILNIVLVLFIAVAMSASAEIVSKDENTNTYIHKETGLSVDIPKALDEISTEKSKFATQTKFTNKGDFKYSEVLITVSIPINSAAKSYNDFTDKEFNDFKVRQQYEYNEKYKDFDICKVEELKHDGQRGLVITRQKSFDDFIFAKKTFMFMVERRLCYIEVGYYPDVFSEIHFDTIILSSTKFNK